MELHLEIIGVILMALALVHIIFPRYFGWRKDLAPLQLINRQMMYVHTLFIALTIFLMGFLCLTSSRELVHTTLGHRISLGFGIFWAVRLFVQFFGYSSVLWKGKKLETAVHVLFVFLWTYFCAVFFAICMA